eukprot:jgi/Tetstr1/455832/TSEL_042624.t1
MPQLQPLAEFLGGGGLASAVASAGRTALIPLGEGGIIPPRAPCEKERLAYLRGSGLLNKEFNASYKELTEAVQKLFQIKVSFFALADQARMVFKAETGLGMAEAPRDVSFCPWNFLNFVPQVTTIPDADIDARFTTNPLITAGLAKCYAGAPIQADCGLRLGTLCVIGDKARRFAQDETAFLANMAQVLGREMDAGLDGSKIVNKSVLVVDTRQGGCPILYANERAVASLAMERTAVVGAKLLDVFKAGVTIESLKAIVNSKQLITRVEAVTASPNAAFLLSIQSAVKLPLYSDTPCAGSPAHAEPGDSAVSGLLFVTLEAPGTPAGPSPVICSNGIELRSLIGESPTSRVFRGVRDDGTELAVRVVRHGRSSDSAEEDQLPPRNPAYEQQLHAKLKHPGLVELHALLDVEGDTWMAMELCNRGKLSRNMQSGCFRQRTAPWSVDMRAVLDAAVQVADCLVHFHSHGVVHGNLSGNNVLLHQEGGNRLQCKVADLSMAVAIETDNMATAFIRSARHSTVPYMPPELLLDGEISFKTDVFSFGVILWEMFHGARAWESVDTNLIMARSGVKDERPEFHETTPLVLRHLIEACWSADAAERPMFMEILQYLKDMQKMDW